MQRLLNIYSGTVIKDILVLKEQIRDILLKSQDKKEGYLRRDKLCNNDILRQNKHFTDIFKFLSTSYFERRVKFLDYPEVPIPSLAGRKCLPCIEADGEGPLWF